MTYSILCRILYNTLVQLAKGSTEFNMFGHMMLSWNDSRLGWDPKEWGGIDTLELKDSQAQEVWTPSFTDET